MSITTVSGQEFNRDSSGARRAAQNGPVFITDRGRPATSCSRSTNTSACWTAPGHRLLVAMSGPEIDFEPRSIVPVLPPADLS